MSDMVGWDGNVVISESITHSNRDVQPLNWRPVFHYDHTKYCPPDQIQTSSKPLWHYEKMKKDLINYFYVSWTKPSGIPWAILVSDDEAKWK